MTQAQALQAARRIPFNPYEPLPADVEAGLRARVAKPLRRSNMDQGVKHSIRALNWMQNGGR